jgi:carbonic anhydrase/acetyltransferase-like protein (isoleucine patch superfamily)
MSAGPASALDKAHARSPQIASSAVVVGTARLGEGSLPPEGAVIRSEHTGVEIGTGSAVLENSVVVGTIRIPTTIERRTVFGHRCKVIGATVGRPVRDRQRLHAHARRPGRGPRVPRRGDPRAGGDDTAQRR